jgi:hypothetical protein
MNKNKPFDLKAALRGEKVVTRDGREVSSVTHFPSVAVRESVIAVIEGRIYTFTSLGFYYEENNQSQHDLLMAAKTVTKFSVVYIDGTGETWNAHELFDTIEEARAKVSQYSNFFTVATVTWEE